LIASTVVGGYYFQQSKHLDDIITVTGSAERNIRSDDVKWTSSFSRSVTVDQLKTGTTQMKTDLDNIKKLFLSKGVTEQELTVQPMTVTPTCDSNQSISYDKLGGQFCGSNKIIGYNLQQVVVIDSANVDLITKLAQDATTMLTQSDVIFSSAGLEYYYTHLDDLRIEMLAEATKNAAERARRIVNETGSSLGAIRSASQGVFQITAVNSADISDYGAYDTTSIDKKITAVVRTSFGLK
jgi:hypothetical protein